MASINQDKTASWANRSNYNGAWYKSLNGGGTCFDMIAHGDDRTLSIFNRDTASSWRTNHGC